MKGHLRAIGAILSVFVFLAIVAVVSIRLTSESTSAISPVVETTPTKIPPYPSQILDLSNWKITMPFGNSSKPTRAMEVKQPALSTYKVVPWFTVTSDGLGVVFRAPVNAPTTSGSNYPRSELREMENDGQDQASWSSTNGTHTMFIDEAITAVPKTKKQVVAGQIHDDDDDVLVIRLDYPKLYVNVDGKNLKILDSNYKLGTRFNVKLVVNGGKTYVYYNNSLDPVFTLSKAYNDSYFKAGAYTQSNCSKEKPSLCNSDNYGEVAIYELWVDHQ